LRFWALVKEWNQHRFLNHSTPLSRWWWPVIYDILWYTVFDMDAFIRIYVLYNQHTHTYIQLYTYICKYTYIVGHLLIPDSNDVSLAGTLLPSAMGLM
jgi:hypothetical protein